MTISDEIPSNHPNNNIKTSTNSLREEVDVDDMKDDEEMGQAAVDADINDRPIQHSFTSSWEGETAAMSQSGTRRRKTARISLGTEGHDDNNIDGSPCKTIAESGEDYSDDIETKEVSNHPIKGARKDRKQSFWASILASARSSLKMENALTEDCYSLMYLSQVRSPTFFYSLFVCAIQSVMLLLVFFDMVQFGSTTQGVSNPLNIPPGVDLAVSVAQAVGIILIVMQISSDGDLTTGIGMLADGYDSRLMITNPGATCGKWLMSALAQCFVGLMMTVDLFVLLMRSVSVIELCLNFAALGKMKYSISFIWMLFVLFCIFINLIFGACFDDLYKYKF